MVSSIVVKASLIIPSSVCAFTSRLSFQYFCRQNNRRCYCSSLLTTTPTKTTLIAPTTPRQPLLSITRIRMKSTTKTASTHYERHESNDSYEQAYFYEPGVYMEHLTKLVQQRLGLTTTKLDSSVSSSSPSTTRRIIDIGGGTGNFARALLADGIQSSSLSSNQDSKREIIVVDPFLSDSQKQQDDDGNRNNSKVHFVKAPAEAFLQPSKNNDEAWWRRNMSQVLLKEVVHHLEDRVGIFQGMYQDLTPTTDDSMTIPSILIITRPQIDIDYPLWDDARKVWADNQPSSELLKQELADAGFTNIEDTIEGYPCSIEFSKWQQMIYPQRFWSTFSNFSDDQLQKATRETIPNEWNDRIDKDGVIHFEDRLVFITAQKMK